MAETHNLTRTQCSFLRKLIVETHKGKNVRIDWHQVKNISGNIVAQVVKIDGDATDFKISLVELKKFIDQEKANKRAKKKRRTD